MQTGHYISGALHLGILGWMLIGGWFWRAPPPAVSSAADVTLISEAELQSYAATTPEVAPAAPELTEIETPESSVPDVDVAEAAPQTPATPEPVELSPEPEPETPPSAPPPPEAPRVAPEIAPEPSPQAETAPEVQEATTPEPSEQVVEEAQEETAPEAATAQIITEATETSEPPVQDPIPTTRPKARPRQLAETAPDPTPDPVADAVAAAVAEAAEPRASTRTPDAALPVGPPMTGSEKDALRVAVQGCWNVGSLSTEAMQVTVTVGVSMDRKGKPVQGSIRMLDSQGGSSAAANQAYETARRAIIRCGARGYDLPVEKYAQWQEIEMTFNPERMRIK